MAQSKQYKDNAQKYDRDALHSDEDAVAILKSFGTKKFDETVDIVIRLGVDPRKADQMIRSTVALPSGTGKDVRIAVFAQGEAAQAARDAGADHVGGDDLAAEVEKGMTDFDLAIATPDMMPTVGKLGRVLGPRGLMPNPKTGTVTPDVAKAIGEFGATITFVANIPGQTQTLPSAIYALLQVPGGENTAIALVLWACVLALGAVVLSEWLARRVARRIADS